MKCPICGKKYSCEDIDNLFKIAKENNVEPSNNCVFNYCPNEFRINRHLIAFYRKNKKYKIIYKPTGSGSVLYNGQNQNILIFEV